MDSICLLQKIKATSNLARWPIALIVTFHVRVTTILKKSIIGLRWEVGA
jgi:hypothetical protein